MQFPGYVPSPTLSDCTRISKPLPQWLYSFPTSPAPEPGEERDSLKAKLESLDVLPITTPVWEKAYELGFTPRKKGVTLPTTDLIIAALAIEHGSLLLHQDEHFERIASNFTDLRTKYFKTKP